MFGRARFARYAFRSERAGLLLVFASACSSPPPPAGTGESRQVQDEPVIAAPVAVAVQPVAAAPAANGEDWNDDQIAWQPFARGLEMAAAQHKPICLVMFTTWCSHCKIYSRVFSDRRVVAAAKDFVMVKFDSDSDKALSSKYAPDGAYVPRTYFLASNGTLDAEIHAQRPKFKYFYDESDPTSLLQGMAEARSKLN